MISAGPTCMRMVESRKACTAPDGRDEGRAEPSQPIESMPLRSPLASAKKSLLSVVKVLLDWTRCWWNAASVLLCSRIGRQSIAPNAHARPEARPEGNFKPSKQCYAYE